MAMMRTSIVPKYPSIEPIDDSQWRTLNTIVMWSDAANMEIIIPKGFITDGASVPRVLWRLAPPIHATHLAAAIVHDYLYRCRRLPHVEVSTTFVDSRAVADAVFYEALVFLGMSRIKARVMWLGVRVGGGFGSNKREKINYDDV